MKVNATAVVVKNKKLEVSEMKTGIPQFIHNNIALYSIGLLIILNSQYVSMVILYISKMSHERVFNFLNIIDSKNSCGNIKNDGNSILNSLIGIQV